MRGSHEPLLETVRTGNSRVSGWPPTPRIHPVSRKTVVLGREGRLLPGSPLTPRKTHPRGLGLRYPRHRNVLLLLLLQLLVHHLEAAGGRYFRWI